MDSNAAGLLPVLILLASSVIAVAVCRSARLPPMIGYLLTGLALGPHALGVFPSARKRTAWPSLAWCSSCSRSASNSAWPS